MSSSNYEHSIEINRGTDNGIAKDMPVVASGGLVGKVVEVSKTRSIILLITDPSLSVGVRLSRTADVGVAGDASRKGELSIDMVPATADIQTNDVVVTSGLQSSIYPPDIPVGKVSSSPRPKSGALQRDITMKPSVDFAHLSFVKVLQWSPNNL